MVDTWINTLVQDVQVSSSWNSWCSWKMFGELFSSPHLLSASFKAESSSQTDRKKRSDRKDPVASSHQGSAHTLRGPRRGPRVAGTGRQPSTGLWVSAPELVTQGTASCCDVTDGLAVGGRA